MTVWADSIVPNKVSAASGFNLNIVAHLLFLLWRGLPTSLRRSYFDPVSV
jgi:hypothetical protein